MGVCVGGVHLLGRAHPVISSGYHMFSTQNNNPKSLFLCVDCKHSRNVIHVFVMARITFFVMEVKTNFFLPNLNFLKNPPRNLFTSLTPLEKNTTWPQSHSLLQVWMLVENLSTMSVRDCDSTFRCSGRVWLATSCLSTGNSTTHTASVHDDLWGVM